MLQGAGKVSFWIIAAATLAACGERDEAPSMARADDEQTESWNDDLETKEPGEETATAEDPQQVEPDSSPATDEDSGPATSTNQAPVASTFSGAPAGASGGRSVGSNDSQSTSSGNSGLSPSGAIGQRAVGSTPSPADEGIVAGQPVTPQQSDLGSTTDTASDSEADTPSGEDNSVVAGDSANEEDEANDSTVVLTYDDGWEVVYDEPPQPIALIDELTTPDDWWLFEQVIPFRPECYELDLAVADIVQIDGESALSLTANASGSTASNHALLGRFLTATPVALGSQRLSVDARLAPGSSEQTQTGPEVSVQISARMTDGTYRTTVFGLQYVATTHTWQVLTGGEEKGAWSKVAAAPLTEEAWYRIEFTFDPARNRYTRLTVTGPDGFRIDEPIAGLGTGWADKGATGPATWVTLDAENLFTCDRAQTATTTVFYKNLSLTTVG